MRGVEAECREQTAYCFKCSELRPASVRGERRQDQRAKEPIDLRRSQRAAALDPPIQHQDERGRDVLGEEIRWNLDACVSSRRRAALYMAGDQLDEHFPKVFVKDGPATRSNPEHPSSSFPVNVHEDGKAEPDELLCP